MILYPGGAMDILKNKLNRVCDSFQMNRFQYPENDQEYQAKMRELDQSTQES